MIDENKLDQYGYPRPNGIQDIKGIVLHNTGNIKLSARQLYDYLNNENKTSQGCSYIVDKEEIIQCMPDDWCVYSTGKGKDYATKYLLALEICDNINDDDYKLGQDKAVELIKDLMEQYNISSDEIYFHNDFNDKVYCPHILLDNYGSAKRFVVEEIL